jgi:hypothetical protein
MKVTKIAGLSAQLKQTIQDIEHKQLRVGWGDTIKYDDGTSVAMIAAQNEFGNAAKSIPPRPFMRPAISAHKMTWSAKLAQGTKTVLNGKRSIGEVFEAVGLLVAGDIYKQISRVTSPALSNTTIELRRVRATGEKIGGKRVGEAFKAGQSAFFSVGSGTSNKPLVDTGYMLNSLTSEVVEK